MIVQLIHNHFNRLQTHLFNQALENNDPTLKYLANQIDALHHEFMDHMENLANKENPDAA